jgi:hypothetical protein
MPSTIRANDGLGYICDDNFPRFDPFGQLIETVCQREQPSRAFWVSGLKRERPKHCRLVSVFRHSGWFDKKLRHTRHRQLSFLRVRNGGNDDPCACGTAAMMIGSRPCDSAPQLWRKRDTSPLQKPAALLH